MFLFGQRYNNLSSYFINKFGEKLVKLPLDAGLSCPNRDGKLSEKGCLFCNEKGSGDFTSSKLLSIEEQIEEQKKLLSRKSKSGKYIAYFQNFTNTYADPIFLKKIYSKALNCEGIVGLAIATRPDCLDDEIITLLDEFNKKTFLWIELGLQTIHEKTAHLINRAYPLDVFENSFYKLKKKEIKTVIHLIVGLPYESKKEILESVDYVSKINPWGIKLHLLHILKDSPLNDFYMKNHFHLLSLEEYADIITQSISLLNPSIIIHRITGDGNKDNLIEPKWSLNKKMVLNTINKTLKIKNIEQGSAII